MLFIRSESYPPNIVYSFFSKDLNLDWLSDVLLLQFLGLPILPQVFIVLPWCDTFGHPQEGRKLHKFQELLDKVVLKVCLYHCQRSKGLRPVPIEPFYSMIRCFLSWQCLVTYPTTFLILYLTNKRMSDGIWIEKAHSESLLSLRAAASWIWFSDISLLDQSLKSSKVLVWQWLKEKKKNFTGSKW